jgi:hypothetical protein
LCCPCVCANNVCVWGVGWWSGGGRGGRRSRDSLRRHCLTAAAARTVEAALRRHVAPLVPLMTGSETDEGDVMLGEMRTGVGGSSPPLLQLGLRPLTLRTAGSVCGV